MKKLKIYIKGVLSAFLLLACMSSCQKDLQGEDIIDSSLLKSEVSEIELKKDFGKALAKVLSESVEARELIKEHALRKINYDFDVLYYLVNNIELSSGTTLEGLMKKYLSEATLDLIETKLPTITIFIPILPENSFSAEIWDTKESIPNVAIKTDEIQGVPMYDAKGNETIIENPLIPSFPIVVVKTNERIIASTATKSESHNVIEPIGNTGKQLMFLGDAFNNINPVIDASYEEHNELRSGGINDLPADIQKVYEACLIYKNVDGWQRDFVYYDIKPGNTRGNFKNEYMEYLSSFKMLGSNPTSAFNKISKSTDTDPKINMNEYTYGRDNPNRVLHWWTDGQFEFQVKISVGTKHPTGNEIIQYFAAYPEELFRIKTVLDKHGYYRPDGTIFEALTLQLDKRVPLFSWDLEYYSPLIKITISEIDNPTTTTQVVSQTFEFATNFELNGSAGEKDKVGFKWGASAKETRTSSYQVSTTYGNDDLGEVLINFGDKAILNDQLINIGASIRFPKYAPQYNYYNTFWYQIEITPRYKY